MSQNQKKTIIGSVDILTPGDLGGTLLTAKETIDSLIKLHGQDAILDWDPYFYYPYDEDPSPQYDIKLPRLETDEELSKRLTEEARCKEIQMSRDKAEFERLSKLFGKK